MLGNQLVFAVGLSLRDDINLLDRSLTCKSFYHSIHLNIRRALITEFLIKMLNIHIYTCMLSIESESANEKNNNEKAAFLTVTSKLFFQP